MFLWPRKCWIGLQYCHLYLWELLCNGDMNCNSLGIYTFQLDFMGRSPEIWQNLIVKTKIGQQILGGESYIKLCKPLID